MLYTFTNRKNTADFSLGVKADCFFGGGVSVFAGTTIGAGFSTDLNKWAVRPEVGAMFIGDGAFLSYGIGLQFIIPKKNSTK
jgi:acetyltransferase-like isoleucine patch superfamily enzyme